MKNKWLDQSDGKKVEIIESGNKRFYYVNVRNFSTPEEGQKFIDKLKEQFKQRKK